ncbi:hypothetical protein GOBAR_AA14749 [Gossypium barbadense]|uniref:Uncharacterized protein n=1 Tax=Gossypium barbadense TaxID=3634 RepID=A0A2P5XRE0_GOSBA|nr:hypothetical protein GOBAR_AA14749 [Gossypium barbadense]
MSSSCGKKTAVPASRKRKEVALSSGPTMEIRHPFLQIVVLTYLEFTLELCSTFHLQTVMTNFDDPGTVQFRLGGLDPPTQPPPSSRLVHAVASYADISECLTRFEQQCFQRFDHIDATLYQICHHLHISSPPLPRKLSSDEDALWCSWPRRTVVCTFIRFSYARVRYAAPVFMPCVYGLLIEVRLRMAFGDGRGINPCSILTFLNILIFGQVLTRPQAHPC